jgi:Undecaprenyl-phosphate glucose phosphotransferase
MHAATPKADPHLFHVAAIPDNGPGHAADSLHAFPAAELAGITPLRPGLQDPGVFARIPANDQAPPRPTWPPLALGGAVLLLDVAALAGAGLGANAIAGAPALANEAKVVALVVALTLGGGLLAGAYDHPFLFGFRRQARRIGAAALTAFVAMLAAAWAFGALERLGAPWLGVFALCGAAGLAGGRGIATALAGRLKGAARRTSIIGTGPPAARLVAALRRDPAGLEVIGAVDDRAARGALPRGVPLLGGMAQLAALIRRGEVDVVAIALPWSQEARILGLLDELSAFPVEVRLAPDMMAARLPDTDRAPLPALLCRRPISGAGGAVKAGLDYLLAGAALAVAAVPMLLIAIAIRLDSPGPVLFRQRRIGFNDRPFQVFKFRTMFADAADHDARRQVLAGDPRVTRIGRLLRRTSLDELPQLFNVLRGEMSVVGPRPHAPGTRAGTRRFDEVVANYAARHRVKPGLTGLAQVRGLRGPTPDEELLLRRVESDLEYIARWSPWLDLQIILRTPLVVVRARNAL